MKTKTLTLTQPLTLTLKTHVRVCVAIAGLLIAGASASAQVAPSAPATVAPNYAMRNHNYNYVDETFYVLPKLGGANLFASAGFQYVNTTHRARKAGEDGYDFKQNLNFFGASASFGWRIDAHNIIQVDVAALGAYKDRWYEEGYEETTALVTHLFTYSVCIPISPDWRWELRLSPSAGYAYTNVSERWNYSSGSVRHGSGYSGRDRWESDGDFSLACGAGAGVTFHVSGRVQLDAGYRYLRATGPKIWGVRYDGMNLHAFTLSCGVKF